MNMDKYEEMIRAFVPEDEEEKRDYQRAIQASMRLRYLEIPERLEDDVYDRMYEEVSKNNDQEQMLQFERDYIKLSEYESQYEELVDILLEIEEKYKDRFSREMLNDEYWQEVENKRNKLRALKLYWERNAESSHMKSNLVMRNVDVDRLSNEEVLGMYERIFNANNVSFSALDEYVRLGFQMMEQDRIREEEKRQDELRREEEAERKRLEEEREKRLAPIRERVDRFRQKPEPSAVEVDEEVTVSEVEERIRDFMKVSAKIEKEINLLTGTLKLDIFTDLDISEGIRNLDEEVKILGADAKGLLEEMDLFDKETKQNGFSMTPSEINKKVEEFKERLKELKILQVNKYNARVEYTNGRIRELKAMTGLEPEVEAMIQGLVEMDLCNVKITNWTVNSYLKNGSIDYNKLVEVNKVIADISSRLGMEVPSASEESLDSDIQFIEKRLDEIDTLIVDDLDEASKNQLKQDLDVIKDRITDFELKLENNKDNVSEEEYNAYKARISDANSKVVTLRNRLVREEEIYVSLEKRTTEIEREVANLEYYVKGLKGLISEDGVLNVLEVRRVDIQGFVEELREDIEVSHKEGKIDVNQYDTLLNRLNKVEVRLTTVKDNLKDPGMIKGADIFAVLNGEIDGLGIALTSLEEQVEKLDKPIKRENRKQIDLIIKQLENEIKRIENNLNQYIEKNPSKYEESMNKLNELKARMSRLGKDYRKKCPLLVRATKSAKDFYKKHRKKILVVAGLAAFALVSHHVLIPAIIHGNIMIAGTTPAVRPFVKFCNSILGGVIGATKDASGMWWLANGVRINPSCAASSLLKGLAVSGIGTTAMVAPLVVAIKKLIEKMNSSELKEKFKEEHDNFKKKSADKARNAKETLKKGRDKLVDKFAADKAKAASKKNGKEAGKELSALLNKYYNSGKSLEDFAKEEELTEEELMILKHFSEKTYESSGKKKRR